MDYNQSDIEDLVVNDVSKLRKLILEKQGKEKDEFAKKVQTAVCFVRRKEPVEDLIKDFVTYEPWADAAIHLGHYSLKTDPLENNVRKVAAASIYITSTYFLIGDCFDDKLKKIKLGSNVEVTEYNHHPAIKFDNNPNHYGIDSYDFYSLSLNLTSVTVMKYAIDLAKRLLGDLYYNYWENYCIVTFYEKDILKTHLIPYEKTQGFNYKVDLRSISVRLRSLLIEKAKESNQISIISGGFNDFFPTNDYQDLMQKIINKELIKDNPC